MIGMFYSTPYESSVPELCAVIDAVVIHNAMTGKAITENTRTQSSPDPPDVGLTPHPPPENLCTTSNHPPVVTKLKRSKEGHPISKVTRIVNKSIGPGTPFVGDFSGGSWNAQSLFCECNLKANRKRL